MFRVLELTPVKSLRVSQVGKKVETLLVPKGHEPGCQWTGTYPSVPESPALKKAIHSLMDGSRKNMIFINSWLMFFFGK